jgi:hypothetical protein
LQARAGGRALTGRPGGVSDRGGEHTDRSGPAPGDTGTDRQARAQGARARSGILRSGSCDQDRTGEIRPGGERLWAAPLLLATVKSPELGRARARVVPGSLGLGREGENDTANSVVGK